jgi:hypothetical protein
MSRTIPILGWLVALSCAAQPAPRTDATVPESEVEADAGAKRQTPAPPPLVRQATQPQRRTAPPADPPQPEFLIWSEQDDTVFTVWVSAHEGDGYRVHARREGRWLATGGTAWELTIQETQMRLPGCDELLSAPRPGRERLASTQQLHASTDSRSQVLYAPSRDIAPTDASIRELSVIGRYLLAETQEWVESCGAFSSETRALRAWDLATWDAVDLDYEQRSKRTELLADAKTAIGDECEDILHLGVGAFRPNLDGPTMLGEYAVTMTPSCDSFPEWTNESSHVLLRSPDLPTLLAPYAEIPAPVRAFIADTPEATPRGWSMPIELPSTRVAQRKTSDTPPG